MSDGAGKYRRLLSAAVENISNAFYDTYVEVNCRVRAMAGLKVTVIRDEIGDCCGWCADLAGIYDYETVPKEVWGRHEHCRCIVTTRTEKGTYQDAWSRREYASYRKNRIAREQELLTEQKAVEMEIKNNIELDTGWTKGYIIPPDNVKELMRRYDEDVAGGWISPNARFDNYLQQYMRIENEIIGQKTVNGIEITEQSKHFMQRVLGTIDDPNEHTEEKEKSRKEKKNNKGQEKHQFPRSGVSVDDIKEALFKGDVGKRTVDKEGRTGQEFSTDKCLVSINPDTGKLVQCNPL